jgi:sulfur carrier protein ThiS
LTVGRAAGNDVSLPGDETLSALHAALERTDAGWSVRDLGSTNGTFVSGERIADRPLRDGDEIVVGHTTLVFRAPAAAAAPPPAADVSYLDATDEWRGAGAAPPAAPATAPSAATGASPQSTPRAEPAAHTPSSPRTPPPAAAPTPAAPASSQRLSGAGSVRGIARNVQTRRGQDEREVLALRVDRYDAEGNRLPPVAVEYVGYSGGQISDGEEVEVVGRWKGGALRASRIVNLSTNAEVRGTPRAQLVAQGVAIFLVLSFILIIIFLIIKDEVL